MKSLLVDYEEWSEGLWEEDEVHEEGMITHDELDVLEEFLPMYIDGGFHSIISVTLEERYEPTILKRYKL